MSTQLQESKPRKPGSVLEVLDSKTLSANSNVRYDYWRESQKPLICIVFLLPLLAWYELGMILHPEAFRSGIDRLLHHFVGAVCPGTGLLSVLCIGILLFVHHRQKHPGQFRIQTVAWMLIESVALATILFLASDALMLYFDNQRPKPLSGLTTLFSDPQQYGRMLSCLGAGIHEEIVFRLLMFAPLCYWLSRRLQNSSLALVIAAIFVSTLFSIAHIDMINPEGTPFQISTFLFRFLASVILCFLFRFRGIAVAIGVHAVFDILAIS